VALEIHVEGLAQIQQRLASSPQQLASETRSAMTAGLTLLEGAARRNAPRDTGRLQGSITHRIEGSGANLTGRVGPSVRYAYWVEHGRAAGRQPPIGAISGWASRHGISPFVLARAIGRRGTRPQPFLAPALAANRGRVVSLFERIGVRVAAYIAGG
jgi:HK97 gp10 family phage protein